MNQPTRRDFVQRAALLTGSIAATGVSSGGNASIKKKKEENSSKPVSKNSKLRSLLNTPGVTIVPEAYSLFAARLAEINNFDAIYIGGNMMAGMYLGIEDWGLVNNAELLEIGSRIAKGVSVPAIVDADQGGETALNVYRTVKSYESAGISGLHIEDTRNPKHMGQGKSELMPLEEMLLRISAAVDGRSDPEFVIIARSDCLILGNNRGNTGEAIRRGIAFAEAGADAFFCVGMKVDQVNEIAKAIPIPLIALNIPLTNVKNTNLKMDIHAVQVYQAAVKLYETMLQELKEQGQFLRRDERRLSPETVAQVMHTEEYRKLAERWMKLGR